MDCNTGWMSKLENNAKRVIESILVDGKVELTPEEAGLLAVWAAKTAIVAEYLKDGTPPTSSEKSRFHLKNTLTPPSNTHVWVGVYLGGTHEPVPGAIWQYASLVSPVGVAVPAIDVVADARSVSNSQLTGIRIGKMMVVIQQDEVSTYGNIEVPSPWGASLIKVWPLGSVNLSPQLLLPMSDSRFKKFRRDFHRNLPHTGIG